MPAVVTTNFTVSGLSKSTATALDRKAKRQGMTVDEYLRELIVEDLELDRVAATKTFAELAMPFQKALAGLSDSDLDALSRAKREEKAVTAIHLPIRVVLDTNVILRAMVNRASPSRDVVTACETRKAIAILSDPVLDEYRRVLTRLRERDESITPLEIQAQLRKLQYLGEYVRHVRASFVFPRDPTDEKMIELAIEAGATHILTYDADLLSLPTSRSDAGKRFRQRLRAVSVMKPEELIRDHPELFVTP